MNKGKLRILKQLHQTYGNQIDTIFNSKDYQRTCHVFDIRKLKNRFNNNKK